MGILQPVCFIKARKERDGKQRRCSHKLPRGIQMNANIWFSLLYKMLWLREVEKLLNEEHVQVYNTIHCRKSQCHSFNAA